MNRLSDRSFGVLTASACGDALGAGYEFQRQPLPPGHPVFMKGGNGFASGEWTDDTSQMVAIGQAAADGLDLRSLQGREAVARNYQAWYTSPDCHDVGIHTQSVFGKAFRQDASLAEALEEIARDKEARQPNSSGGNGAIMRTAPVALAFIKDQLLMAEEVDRINEAARVQTLLSHYDQPTAVLAAAWCLLIRSAIITEVDGDFPAIKNQALEWLAAITPEDATRVEALLAEAEAAQPHEFPNNGWSQHAVQAAWSAITTTPIHEDDKGKGTYRASHLQRALEACCRIHNDTDTVACIAGGVLGATWGLSAVPLAWRRMIYGWPGMNDRGLVELTAKILGAQEGDWPLANHFDYTGYGDISSIATHPHDPDVVLAAAGAVTGPDPRAVNVTAVVSLCRMGQNDMALPNVQPENWIQVPLVDNPRGNAHTQFLVDQAADAIAQFRSEGHQVLVHCVQAMSRTPSIAARYSVRHLSQTSDDALRDVSAVLALSDPKQFLVDCI